jgi:hypothetical protein
MARTETDLKAMYGAGPSTEAAERRIDAWVTTGVGGPKPRRAQAGRWAAAASALAVAAATVTIAVLVPHSKPGSGPRPPSSAAVSSDTPTAASTVATVPITPQVAQRLLLDLLPRRGTVSGRSGAATPDGAVTELIFNDGHGAAEVGLTISYPVSGRSLTAWACTTAFGNTPPDTCTTRPDGTQTYYVQGYEYPDRRTDVLNWSVAALRPDGMQVQISEWNAAAEKATSVSRPQPPFTIAELLAVATNPAWTARVSETDAERDAGLFVPDDRLNPSLHGSGTSAPPKQ